MEGYSFGIVRAVARPFYQFACQPGTISQYILIIGINDEY